MDILLHVCCAPCAIYPVELLRREGHRVVGYFYNPNIHPYAEYLRRQDEVEKYEKAAGVNICYTDYDIDDYFGQVSNAERALSRCPVCWWLRLRKTALFAKERGFAAFTTTLLGSPYQDREKIVTIGAELAAAAGIAFYDRADFRAGFADAHARAKADGIYCQKYCGCLYSEIERIEKKGGRSASGSRTQGGAA